MDHYGGGNSNRGPGPIPNRWLNCPRTSSSFIVDKFLAFKTPLNQRFSSQMEPEFFFQPETVFSFAKIYKVKLGLWIDLTNTKRFYDRREIETRDCQYHKLSCRGHGETPSPEQTAAFIEIVHQFIQDNPLSIVGVHCTHGFNRTGFLIVSYMVEKMDCSVDSALMAFAQARPPGIYKGDYIKELFRRYDDEDDAIAPPALPDWCFENEEGNDNDDEPNEYQNGETSHSAGKRKTTDSHETNEENDTAANENDEDGTNEEKPKKKRRKDFLNLNATFMAGIQGVTLLTDQEQVHKLQEIIQNMCKWSGSGFPGSQPVSMDLKNIELLQHKPYRVSWKADGTRYMMLILQENEIYFFDRDNSCFQVEAIRFVCPEDQTKHLENTLIDGEMVIDVVNGLSIPRFLVYDIVTYRGESYLKRPFFPDRLSCIKTNIVDSRYRAMKKGLINKQREPFSVRDKMFWEVQQARSLLGEKFRKSLCHEPDGLIFQPSLDPYTPGQSPNVLKWKPPNMNSVDFKLKIVKESGMGIVPQKIGLLFVGQLESPFSKIRVTKDIRNLDGKIIECKFEGNQWTFMRERTDKSYPNSYNTAMSVCGSIQHPVTEEILFDTTEHMRFADDSMMMPPPRGFVKH